MVLETKNDRFPLKIQSQIKIYTKRMTHHGSKYQKRSFPPIDTISYQKIHETNDYFYDKFMIVAE